MEPRGELKLEIVSVEVQKITKPRPKEITQGAIESGIKKEVVSPKGLKRKSHKGTSLKAYEKRRKKKKKKAQIRRLKKDQCKELSRDPQRLPKTRDPRGL